MTANYVYSVWSSILRRDVDCNRLSREGEMSRQVTQSEWGRIVAHAWLDPAFAQKLSTDPAAAVKGFLGVDPSSEVHVLDVPPRPADLTQPQLEDIRSGKSAGVLIAPFSC
jgi:hypothetical protein